MRARRPTAWAPLNGVTITTGISPVLTKNSSHSGNTGLCNNFGGTVGGPIWKNKTFFFFDYDTTRASNLGTYQAGVPSDAERAGDFGEVCGAQGGTFDQNGKCSVAQGQIWDPYSGSYQNVEGYGSGAVRSAYIPYNNIAAYSSPGNPKLPPSLELPAGAGNLIDPVAKKMMQLFPKPSANMANPTIYDNWSAAGASHSPNNQFERVHRRAGHVHRRRLLFRRLHQYRRRSLRQLQAGEEHRAGRCNA
ncbi:hypothetical protein MOP44_14005 [Occallatibacter riparius]|uniref:TonB-dependent transporter Oar-like beta-barrel domain-containing protein n=1 Tax=Occallatibacter riparius TaxID=1002689 RepID=A0A9J7BIT0_9BACT|nr:hypothetical protein [Occallatibacter riparius]UWZ81698.1 hypothetical protein MOP44_14005 [Occallatibacter riparius]